VPAPDPEAPRESAEGATISVVIPVRDESACLHRALECTRRPGVERIVVDGGSRDGSCDVAASLGAERIVESAAGRARQLSVGLGAAAGEVVLFLHADTRLDPGWDRALRRALDDPAVAGGAFRLVFESPRPAYRLVEGGAALRCRLLRLPYGDQGLFTRRKPLVESGGIAPVAIFEDLDLVRGIRRRGRLVLLRERAWTSPRRYERNGVTRTVLRNNVALAAWWIGLDRERVADWYRRRQSR
jgi:rSAM/selenodomain-associated transferase 2